MITIFTPIYNRAYIIERLYRSLLCQTNYGFEWLIVDDGSVDNISDLIHQWMKNTQEFKIRFYQQENRGKHCAINYAVELAQYEALFIVDSDDYLVDDAVETILKYWEPIRADKEYAGVSGLKIFENRKVIGDTPEFHNHDYIDATNLERAKFGLCGDKAEIYKTDILRKFPFPEFENEKFITEDVVWNKIAYQGYKVRWFNKGIMICEYLEDGLTAKGNKLFIQNPKGWAYYIRNQRKYRVWDNMFFLRQCFRYYECEQLYFDDGEIKSMLGISDKEFILVRNSYDNFAKRLTNICEGKRVGIYAYGVWGRRLKRYMDSLDIHTEYVIDKKCQMIKDIVAYSPEMNFPVVDVMIIALKNNADIVKQQMQVKSGNMEIIKLEDLIDELW